MRRSCSYYGIHRHLRFEPLERRELLAVTAMPTAGAAPAGAELAGAAEGEETAILRRAVTSNAAVQQMPSVAVSPLDANHVVIAYMDYSLVTTGYAGIGISVSRDGGNTWVAAQIPLPSAFAQGAAEPVVKFDSQGNLFVSFMAVTFLGNKATLTDPAGGAERALGFQSNNGIFVSKSSDGGLSWQAPVAVVSHMYDGQHPVFFEVIPDFGIDTFATLPDGQANPNHGTMYVTWARYYPSGQFPGEPTSTGGSHIMVAASTDGGQTWETRLTQRGPNGALRTPIKDNFDSGIGPPPALGGAFNPRIAVGAGGEVYIAMSDLGGYSVFRSTDGGRTFVEPDFTTGSGLPFGPGTAIGPTSTRGLPTNKFRTSVVRKLVIDPTHAGHLYALSIKDTIDSQGTPLDQANVIFSRSTDFGETWEQTFNIDGHLSQVLNDDNDGQLPSGSINDVVSGQALPQMAVDSAGNLAVIWYDTRRDSGNHRLDLFGTSSDDGGENFVNNLRITAQSFDADAGHFTDATQKDNFYLGDGLGLALANGMAYAAWTDTSGNNQDILFARYALGANPPSGTDRFEPNDAAETATDLGRVIRRYLPKLETVTGDEDWFHVTTAASGNFIATVTVDEGQAAPRVQLYDDAGVPLTPQETDIVSASGNLIGHRLQILSAPNRTYFVRVLPQSNDVADSARYALEVQSLTSDLGTRVHGFEQGQLNAGDEAYYRLAVGAAGSLSVEVTPSADFEGDLSLEILDGNRLTTIATGQAANGSTQQANIAVTKNQFVFIHIKGDADSLGGFDLEFTNFDQNSTPGNRALLFPAGAGPSQSSLGDVNADDILDVVVSNTLSDTVSVLLGTGDGTFQAPRLFTIGAFEQTVAGESITLPTFRREVILADVNHDDLIDIVAANNASSDVSILLGRGDGTFEPQRRFDATQSPFAIVAGDFDNDGFVDLVVHDSEPVDGSFAILFGRGDGTFSPPVLSPSPIVGTPPAPNMRTAFLNDDENLDLVIVSLNDPNSHVLLGNGDGTFTPAPDVRGFGPGIEIADVNNDDILDLVRVEQINNAISYALGHGDGTFEDQQLTIIGQSPLAVAVGDVGSELITSDNKKILGPPDGQPDLIVAASGVAQPALFGPPEVVVLPGVRNAQNEFIGFGAAQRLISATVPQDVDIGDVNGDQLADIVVMDREGVRVIFNQELELSPNNTPETARVLGTVVHVVQPTLTITPGFAEAWYSLVVPSEAAPGAQDQVLDFSSGFAHEEGAGLQMEILDEFGELLAVGDRLRIVAHQGEMLFVHIFGRADVGAEPGFGAYTLVINTLPQVVSIESQALLVGGNDQPSGPTTSLVIVFQGDRLDPAAAENPANYRVVWLGPDGIPDTADDRIIPIGRGLPASQAVVYDPGSNIDISSGRTFPTAVRQTVTLLFGDALPAGSYEIEIDSHVTAASFNGEESDLLSERAGFTGHPVVSQVSGLIDEGLLGVAEDLVLPANVPGDLSLFESGTRFLTQFHNDLGALLDAQLTSIGDDPSVTARILEQIRARFAPAVTQAGQQLASLLIIFLDPVSIGLIDPEGRTFRYDLEENTVANRLPRTFVEVGGNVEVIVIAEPRSSYDLNLANVSGHARGGAVYLGQQGIETRSFTTDIRNGTRTFTLFTGLSNVNSAGLASIVQSSNATLGARLSAASANGPLRPTTNAAVDAAGSSPQLLAGRNTSVQVTSFTAEGKSVRRFSLSTLRNYSELFFNQWEGLRRRVRESLQLDQSPNNNSDKNNNTSDEDNERAGIIRALRKLLDQITRPDQAARPKSTTDGTTPSARSRDTSDRRQAAAGDPQPGDDARAIIGKPAAGTPANDRKKNSSKNEVVESKATHHEPDNRVTVRRTAPEPYASGNRDE